jgi:RNA polymerase sigma-70 factor, ECF subfamily
LKAYEHLEEFEGNSRFYTWLVRITINQALMKLRTRRPNHFSLDDPIESYEDFLPRELKDKRPTPEGWYSQNELAEILSNVIADLPPTLRAVFRLRAVENISTEETADLLGLSVPAVKSRLLRARRNLREKLNQFFGKGGPYSSALRYDIAEPTSFPGRQLNRSPVGESGQ